jgi:hypothetical protein
VGEHRAVSLFPRPATAAARADGAIRHFTPWPGCCTITEEERRDSRAAADIGDVAASCSPSLLSMLTSTTVGWPLLLLVKFVVADEPTGKPKSSTRRVGAMSGKTSLTPTP